MDWVEQSRKGDTVRVTKLWQELKAYCLAFDGAVEEYPWNDEVYKVKGKVFVFTSGDRSAVLISAKPLPDHREMFLSLPGVIVAKYVGRFGWVSLRVIDAGSLEIAKDLIAESYAVISGASGRGRRRAGAGGRSQSPSWRDSR